MQEYDMAIEIIFLKNYLIKNAYVILLSQWKG